MGAIVLVAPFALAGATYYPPWQHAALGVPTNSGSGTYSNTQAGTTPNPTNGNWVTWASAKTTNVGTAAYEVDGIYYVDVPMGKGWTTFSPGGNITVSGYGYYGWAYLTIGCYSAQGTGSVNVWLNESVNVYLPGTGWTWSSPQWVAQMFTHSLNGACGQTYSNSLIGSWFPTMIPSGPCKTSQSNCTVALYLQMAITGMSTNDAFTEGCLDFEMATNSCSGTHGVTGKVNLGSVATS